MYFWVLYLMYFSVLTKDDDVFDMLLGFKVS